MIRDTSSQDVILTNQTNSRKWKNRVIAIGLIAAVILVGYPMVINWSKGDLSVDRDRVRTATVSRGQFIRDIALQGNIVAANSPKLYAPEAGTITFLVNPGERVARNQILAEINSAQLTNRLEQEQAKIQSLKIDLERQKIAAKQAKIKADQQIQLEKVILEAAEREMRRAKQSMSLNAISQLDFEKATDDLKRSKLKHHFAIEQAKLEKENLAFEIKNREFEVNQFELQVANTQRLVNEMTIKAPVDGIVGSWSVEQKAAVITNQALLTIVDLSAFEVEIDIPESYADELGIGMTARVNYSGKEFPAQVTRIAPEVNNNVVKGRLAFLTDAPDGMKQNQRVTSRVLIDEKQNTLFIPRGSFVQHYGGRQIFRLENRIATLTPVNLGSQSIDKIEIISGLKEGDEVIISNTDFVQDAKILNLN